MQCSFFFLNLKKRCGSNKHASLWNIMGHGDPIQFKYSLHDSDIKNRNHVIIRTTEEVVQQCNELGISFYEEKENVLSSAIHIFNR